MCISAEAPSNIRVKVTAEAHMKASPTVIMRSIIVMLRIALRCIKGLGNN